MISKKLLEEVLTVSYGEGFTVVDFEESYSFDGLHFEYCYGDVDITEKDSINIYELAHKCKEWAYKQKIIGLGAIHYLTKIEVITKHYEDYYVCGIEKSGADDNTPLSFYGLKGRDNHREECWNLPANKIKELRWYADTEQEAIFKACQWILENKEK